MEIFTTELYLKKKQIKKKTKKTPQQLAKFL